MQKSITVMRNAKRVGNNSKRYDDKHPENPVSLRPIRSAIEKTPKLFDAKRGFVPDVNRISKLLRLGNLPRPMIAAECLRIARS